MSMVVQSVLFDKDLWSIAQAKKWLREHGYIAPKVDETRNLYRFRQLEPEDFVQSTYRTISFGDDEEGIQAVVGKLIPTKKNYFPSESDEKDGEGHRIGAYAMLFNKHRTAYLFAPDSADGKAAYAEAKRYWKLYKDASKRYTPIDSRRERRPQLHDFTSFQKAMNFETRKNPMKTRQNPVIDGKILIDNVKGIQALVNKHLKVRNPDLDLLKLDIKAVLSKLDYLGVRAQGITFTLDQRGSKDHYYIMLFYSSMGYISVSIFSESRGRGFITSGKVNYIQFQESEQERYGTLFSLISSKYGKLTTRFWGKNDFAGISNLIGERVVSLSELKNSAYVVNASPYGLEDFITKNNPHCHKENPHCHYVGTKKNPHCTTHGNPRKNPHCAGLAFKYNPPKKIMSFDTFSDALEDGNVFVGRYVIYVQDGQPYRLEYGVSEAKPVSPEVAFFSDLAGQAQLVGVSNIDAFSDKYRTLILEAKKAAKPDKAPKAPKTPKTQSTIVKALIANFEHKMDMGDDNALSNLFMDVAQHEVKDQKAFRKYVSDKFGYDRMMSLENLKKYALSQIEAPPQDELDESFVEEESVQEIYDPQEDADIIINAVIEAGVAAYTATASPEEEKKQQKILDGIVENMNGAFERLIDNRKLLDDEDAQINTKITKQLIKFLNNTGKPTFAKKGAAKTSSKTYNGLQTAYHKALEKALAYGEKRYKLDKGIEAPSKKKTSKKKPTKKKPTKTSAPKTSSSLIEALKDVRGALTRSSDKIDGYKMNPQLHYAYPMSARDHNHLYSEQPLYDFYVPIKKNPPNEEFRFPQRNVMISGGKTADIDKDIFNWIGGDLEYDILFKGKDILVAITESDDFSADDKQFASQVYDELVSHLQKIGDILLEYQTEHVPDVEEKVRKALAKGQTLKQVIGHLQEEVSKKSKKSKNPYRRRASNPARRRYY